MATKKEEIEAKNSVAEVHKAEKKVEELKAKKAADKAKKHTERVEKHPKLGKAINWIDDHKWQVAAGAATGGVSFAAGWFGHKFFGKKAEEPAIEAETPAEESETAPFNTEA